MGIFSIISEMKRKARLDDDEYVRVKKKELKEIIGKRKKLESKRLLEETVRKEKKRMRELKHPMLLQFAKKASQKGQPNLEKAKKKRRNEHLFGKDKPFKII